MAYVPAPVNATMRTFDAHFLPVYPAKRRFKEDHKLMPGMPVAHLGFAATLLKYVPHNVKQTDTCGICLNAMGRTNTDDTNVVIHRCGHAFHKECIEPWRHQFEGRLAPCPLCRTISSDSQVTYLYNEWRIAYDDGTTATVRASSVKRERPPPKVFNPRHKNDYFTKAKEGGYMEPLPKRTTYPSR